MQIFLLTACNTKVKIYSELASMQVERRTMNKELLKAEMDKRKMSANDLADIAGVNRSTIWRILTGETVCSTPIAAKIVNGMKLSPKTATAIFFED